ncbi:MAG: deoxyribodipyrimidine photo-lyase [Alphaproteobacteria bacterium]|nr:deoxyribodipyrimidine photo-lyase [Alphaproteobacteria bacterium]
MSDAALLLFRDDLRLTDNPALIAAVASKKPLIIAYIHDEKPAGDRALGGASQWWLHHSLASLARDIEKRGGTLQLFKGTPSKIIDRLVADHSISAVFWNRRYHPSQVEADKALKARYETKGLTVKSFNGSLLREPWEVKSKIGNPMKVFTPYWRASRLDHDVAQAEPAPKKLTSLEVKKINGAVSLKDLNLLPQKPDWSSGLQAEWTPGEAGAIKRLDDFLENGFKGYAEDRNRPDRISTSRLSPHLRFGEISIKQVWHAAELAISSHKSRASSEDLRVFQSELGWREFAHHLLFHEPDLTRTNVQRSFDGFPWRRDEKLFKSWSRGETGYPIVDAGMRELWQTGFMHNRVRMITASFLVKHLLIDWRRGEEWFWDTLVDADIANNPASWQWVAGSGADAAPYFRIFNPMLQGEKFDPDGNYVRKFVPELKKLSARAIHAPWTAKPLELESAGVILGKTYPKPIVDHDAARIRALDAYKSLKESA